MSNDDDWPEQPRSKVTNIYDLEAQNPTLIRGIRGRGIPRDLHRSEPNSSNRMYRNLSNGQGIDAEGGATLNDGFYQKMSEINYPADEQFRKESQIEINRVRRDKIMKLKKRAQNIKLKIRDFSTDDYVIPCSFPSAIDLKEEKGKEEIVVPASSTKIESFLTISKSTNSQRWADAIEEAGEEITPRRDEEIEKLMINRAVEAASFLRSSTDCIESICLSFEDYPPDFKRRRTDGQGLRTIVIDGCAVMKQANFKFEIPWNPTGGTTNTFKGNKLLLMKPLIELAMRCLLQGHKTIIILPSYYMIPVFAGVRQKVDDVKAFNALVETGIVHFIEEASIIEMHQRLYDENMKHEGTWVSTSDLERIILKYQRSLQNKPNQFGETPVVKEPAKFTHKLTPFFYDNKLVLPLHMSTPEHQIKLGDKLLGYDGDNWDKKEERKRNQLSLSEQKKILLALQDLFDLPLRLLRGMMMFRRILKEMEDNEEEERQIADQVAIQEFGAEVLIGFAD